MDGHAAKLDELAAVLRSCEQGRVAKWLDSDLPELSESEANDMGRRTRMPQIGLRVPDEYLTRADALIEHLQPMAMVHELTRSDTLRLALGRGLDLLESEVGMKATKAKRTRARAKK